MNRRQFIVNSSVLTTGLVGLGAMTLVEKPTKIAPRALSAGDTIALTAPAGAVFNQDHIGKMEALLKRFGFKVVLGKTLTEKEGYLAGSDELRAEELNAFFANTNVHAIFTMRGGWGCGRILDLIDYEAIKANPKIIMGFSDITSLLVTITERTGLITFHGPVGYSSWNTFSIQSVYDTLVEGKKVDFDNALEERDNLETIVSSSTAGEILAGNLTVLCSLVGTPYEPTWEGKILCLEEVGEEPYRIDRMLWQMGSAGVFKKINGLVLGSFKKCEPEFPDESFSLSEVFDQHFKPLSIPVFKGASFGHTANKYNLPIGAMAIMNSQNFGFKLLVKPTHLNG
jgi:muramoyltetrapeptide carboxypeptidase